MTQTISVDSFQPQFLSVEQAKAAAREYYLAGKLTAQCADQHDRNCLYLQEDGTRCAIGAALTDETLGRTLEGETVAMLVASRKLNTDDVQGLQRLQGAHDSWCGFPPNTDGNKYAEQRFASMIGVTV